MTDYAGDPENYPSTVRLLDDGENRNATTNAPQIEDLADRTAYLKEHGGDPIPSMPVSTAVWRTLPDDARTIGDCALWIRNITHTWTSATDDGNELVWTFRPPKNATITEVYIDLIGGPGHSALPEHMPTARIDRCQFYADGTGLVQIWTLADAAATVEAYEALHHIWAQGLSLTLEGTNFGPENGFLALVLTNEWGTDAKISLKVGRPRIKFTCAALDVWG